LAIQHPTPQQKYQYAPQLGGTASGLAAIREELKYLLAELHGAVRIFTPFLTHLNK
jgi:hypothetical protein